MFLLADQPLLEADTINLLIGRFRNSDRGICVPQCRGERKNPTLFSDRYYDRLLNITGDTGARGIITSQPDDVLRVAVDRPEIFLDVDAPDDLARVDALFQKSRQVRHQTREDHQDDHT
jgi:molybdenum cofactor cytidylyltransferase